MVEHESTSELQSTAEDVAKQLNRIIGSRIFRQTDRLKRFLSYVVRETIGGRAGALKEFTVGVEVFNRDTSFDPRSDPIVRVQARRLRAQLERYYAEEAGDDEIVFEMPKGGYSIVFSPVRPTRANRSEKAAVPRLVSRNTVLVLPFSDLSTGGDQAVFCAGLNEEIVLALTKMDSVRLVACSSTAQHPDELTPEDAATRYNAALLIKGSVRKSGATVRIAVNFIDTASGCYVWSQSFQQDLADPFALQDEIAKAVRSQLEIEMSSAAHRKGAKIPTQNLAAYNFYLQGRYHLSQRTEEGLRKSAEFFLRATSEDGQYANAYAGLADAYALLGHYGGLSPAEVWTKTSSNAAWAVLCDEHSAEAHASLAHVKATQDWDWLGAEREFQKAIRLDASYSTAHHWYAVACLAPMGRMEEAEREILLAQALDPISPIIARDLARVFYYMGDYDHALDQCDRTLELNPHFTQAYSLLGFVQEQRGDFEESFAAFQRAIQLSPHAPGMQLALGRAQALSGKRAKALDTLKNVLELAEKRYVSPFEVALLKFALEKTDEGFNWLEKAFADRCFDLICSKVDPRLDAIKPDPRFAELFGRLGLP